MVGCAGFLAELRAMRNPPAPSPTGTAETPPTNASSAAAPDTANKAAADPLEMDWKYVLRTSGMLTYKRLPLVRITSSVALSLVWRMKARWP
jgi:hypothetical protein